uniref:helix-hairpin-helix domain-containing protein n=1 Tax=Streptomyces lonarensis TaxID=700599 RepID=UPI0030C75780
APAPGGPGRAPGPAPAAQRAAGAPASPSSPAEGLAALLAESGAPGSLAGPVTGALGPRAAEVLRADPWALLAAPGVRPAQADDFARALLGEGCGPDDERRTRALAVWLLEGAARRGHTVRTPEELRRDLAAHAVADGEAALEDAVEAGAVLAFQEPVPGAEPDEAGEVPARTLFGLDRCAVAEEGLADGLLRLRATCRVPDPAASADVTKPAEPAADGDTADQGQAPDPAASPAEPDAGAVELASGGDDAPQRSDGPEGAAPDGSAGEAAEQAVGTAGTDRAGGWRRLAAAELPRAARELAAAAVAHGVVVHTGGRAARAEPAELVRAARRAGLRAELVAHAPDAAEVTAGVTARTPAELLAGPGAADRDEEGALALELLAVLDAEQLDTEAAAALVEAMPDGSRLVLSGEPGLLGPAGSGQVLADLLGSRICPRVASRTPDEGPVGELVSLVAAGELARVDAPGNEVVVVPAHDPGEAVHRTVQLLTESIPRAFGAGPADVVVLTTAHGGPCGTRALNAAVKERVNPGPGRFGGFDPGDRAVWSAGVGRTVSGTVREADSATRSLVCETLDGRVTVPADEVSLRHGWVLTAHQAAGRSWPAVVAVVPGDAGALLDRAWVHTAFSRARRHLSVVQGAGPALAAAVAAAPRPRATRLAELLRQGAADSEEA